MNWQHVVSNWYAFAERIKLEWNRLTDEDIRQVHAEKELLVHKIHVRYDVHPFEAHRQVNRWLRRHALDLARH